MTIPKAAATKADRTVKGATDTDDAAPGVLVAPGVFPEPVELPEPPVLPPPPLVFAPGRVAVLTGWVEVGAVAVPRVQVKYHPCNAD